MVLYMGESARTARERLNGASGPEVSYKNDKIAQDSKKDFSVREKMKEKKKSTMAKSDTERELEHSRGKYRQLKTKMKGQKQNITNIRNHFNRGLT